MERRTLRKPRLWMKVDGRDEGYISTYRIPERQYRTIYRPPPPKPRKPKKVGATGLGFRLNVRVCPKVDQIFLAFSTILFIASLDLLVLSLLNVGPGLLSRKFSPATCKIVEKRINYSTYCYVTSFDKNRGTQIRFKCLQVYVAVKTEATNPNDVTTEDMTSQSGTALLPQIALAPLQRQRPLLLYENELHLVGGDYRNRPCSFLPYYCTGNTSDIDRQVLNYSRAIGDVNDFINCHFSATTGLNIEDNGVAMRFRRFTVKNMFHSLLWPLIGVIVSVLCCSIFWRQNHHRLHRLFIYNSWSPS